MRDTVLPLSILVLAAAIAWHGMPTAVAQAAPPQFSCSRGYQDPAGKNLAEDANAALASGKQHLQVFTTSEQLPNQPVTAVAYFCAW